MRAEAARDPRLRPDPRLTVVVITRNRREELLRTLGRLAALPERPPVIVVDNGSDDGTTAAVRGAHPGMLLIAARRNLGAVGTEPRGPPGDHPVRGFL